MNSGYIAGPGATKRRLRQGLCGLARESPIDGSAGTGFSYDNGRESWEQGLKPIPNPHRYHFAGRIFETGDVIEMVVIELLKYWQEGCLQNSKITHPPQNVVDGSGYMDLDPERVPMQPRTLVALRYVG